MIFPMQEGTRIGRKAAMLAKPLRCVTWLALALPVAALELAPLFQDGAVLQRERPVPVWGWAEPGARIDLSFGGQAARTVVAEDGRWRIDLTPMQAEAEGRDLVVSIQGGAQVVVKDVLVGEVWLASGQSNMQWSIAQSSPANQQEASAGPVPGLRLFQVPREVDAERRERVKASWQQATPETAKEFSAVAYFFGRKIREEIGVPVGMIHSSWGGSRIEPWWAEEGLAGIPELDNVRVERLKRSPGFPEYDRPFRDFLVANRAWSDEALGAVDAGKRPPAAPAAPGLLEIGHNKQAGTYQAMIHPLVPYSLRGFLWYQGESNNGEGMAYLPKKRALIAGWRKQFEAPEAPFLFVQLAPFHYGENRDADLPGIWEAQQACLAIPHTGMAVINDIGNIRDIHPSEKAEVGRRLARWALADTYGKTGVVKSGPLFSGHEVKGDAIVVRFEHANGGLKTRDGKAASHFQLAGADGVFHAAEAEILEDGASLRLRSGNVPEPKAARFAWSQIAEPNLINAEGLPAGAFHTR
jgi:sialate O-acetylesterase